MYWFNRFYIEKTMQGNDDPVEQEEAS